MASRPAVTLLCLLSVSLSGLARAEPEPGAASAPDADTLWKVPVDTALDPVVGPPDALVTLVVFSDYQCPYCKRLEVTLAQLRERYRPDLRVVMRHNPLPFHPQAMPAARAAVCAHAQTKFAPMHEGLMQASFDTMSEGLYLGLAKKIGLDLRAFDACLAARTTSERIAADQAAALSVGARGTPTTFVNGRRISGAQPISVFAATIDAELDRARAAIEAGVARRDLYASLVAKGRITEPLGPRQAIDTTDAPRIGPPEAPIAVAWFGSLGGAGSPCQRCGESLAAVRSLVAESRGRVTATFHLVTPATASDARAAAEAAMCAHRQGAFLDYSDLVLDAARRAPSASLAEAIPSAAKDLALDADKLLACFGAKAHAAFLDRQEALAKALAVTTTPAIFIDGRRLDGSLGLSRDVLQSVIDRYFPAPTP